MRNNSVVVVCLLVLIFSGCRCMKEVDCIDKKIQPAFIGFQLAEIDTLIIRKFKAADNFQTRIDSFRVVQSNAYRTLNDTTKIIYYQLDDGIIPGFDWQIIVPAINRTVLISEIMSNKKTIECGTLVADCGCANDILSAKVDNQSITFRIGEFETPFVYIRR